MQEPIVHVYMEVVRSVIVLHYFETGAIIKIVERITPTLLVDFYNVGQP